MSRGVLVGCTDYSHQTFADIISDLKAEADLIGKILTHIDESIAELKKSGYWERKVSHDFEISTLYALKHFRTARSEMLEILGEIQNFVETHHCSRLRRISDVAHKVHGSVGIAWHQHYRNKEYGNKEFRIVEKVYTDIRSIAGNLFDIANMALRLEDFVGKGSHRGSRSNPWVSGTFYLFAAVVLLVLVAVLASWVNWVIFPVVLIACMLLLGLVGVLQLRNDQRLSEANFVQLFIETYKRLPLLQKR